MESSAFEVSPLPNEPQPQPWLLTRGSYILWLQPLPTSPYPVHWGTPACCGANPLPDSSLTTGHSCLLWGKPYTHLPLTTGHSLPAVGQTPTYPPTPSQSIGHSYLVWDRHSHMVWLHVILFQAFQHRWFKA